MREALFKHILHVFWLSLGHSKNLQKYTPPPPTPIFFVRPLLPQFSVNSFWVSWLPPSRFAFLQFSFAEEEATLCFDLSTYWSVFLLHSLTSLKFNSPNPIFLWHVSNPVWSALHVHYGLNDWTLQAVYKCLQCLQLRGLGWSTSARRMAELLNTAGCICL